MTKIKHHIFYCLSIIIIIALGISIFYSVLENSYYKGVKDASTFMRCKAYIPWTADLEAMKHRTINDCLELTAIIDDPELVAVEPKIEEEK